MANRSYIYGLKNNKHISIGEYPYKIPYAFRILAAYENKTTDSDLFDKAVGIKANFHKGKKGLYELLDFLAASDQMKNYEEFEAAVLKTKEFLDKIDAEEVLLESGEIYALFTNKEGDYLDAEGLERTNGYAREDYQWLGEDIENLKKIKITATQLFITTNENFLKLYGWIIDLKDNWKEQLGLDAWARVLYFQFKETD